MSTLTVIPPPHRLFLRQNKAYNLAVLLTKRQHYFDAMDRFKILLASNRKLLPDILIPLYKQLISRDEDLPLRILIAELYMSCDMAEEALQELEDNLERDLHFPNTYLILSKISKNPHFANQVLALFEKAFSEGMIDTAVTDHLAHVYLGSASPEKAILLFEKLNTIHPSNVYYKKTLAELYCQNHDLAKSATTYQELSHVAPEHTHEAATRCENILAFDPNNIDIRTTLVHLLLKSMRPNDCLHHVTLLCAQNPAFKEEALSVVKQILEVSPSHPTALMTKAKLLMDLKRPVEALDVYSYALNKVSNLDQQVTDALQEILSADPQNYMALELLCTIHLSHKRYRQGLTCLEHMIEINHSDMPGIEEQLTIIIKSGSPFFLDAVCVLGQLCLKAGHYERAIEEVQVCMGTDHENQAKLIQAKSEVAMKSYFKAKRTLLEILKHNPFENDAHPLLCNVYAHILTSELEHTDTSLKKQPNQHWFKIGLVALRQGRFTQAMENFQKISHSPVLQQKALLLIARCFLEMGRFDLSINQFTSLLASTENDPELRNQIRFFISLNLIHSGKSQQAITSLEQLLESDIHFPFLSTLLTRFRNQAGVDSRGKALAGCYNSGMLYLVTVPNMEPRAVGQLPQSVSFGVQHNNQAVEFCLKQQFKAAEEECDLAIQIESDLTVAYCNRAILSLVEGKPNDAIQQVHMALSLNPHLDLPYCTLGLIALSQNELDSAEWHFKRALSLNPDLAVAHLNLGDIYWKKNAVKEALHHWHKAHRSGALFYLAHRRVHYLHQHSFSFKHWVTDMVLPFTTSIPIEPEAAPTLLAKQEESAASMSPTVGDQPLSLFE